MKKIVFIALLSAALSGCAAFEDFVKKLPQWKETKSPITAATKQIYTGEVIGQNENVSIFGSDLPLLKAKLDSAITTSAMDVEIVRIIKEDDKEFAVYRVHAEGDVTREFEKRIVRWERSKNKENNSVLRPVVVMELCIGNKQVNEEVALADRGRFLYPLIVGNNAIKDRFIVDPSKSFTAPPNCG